VLGERAISAADRGARECGVSQRTGANRSSAGFGAVWDRQNNYVGASAVDVAWGAAVEAHGRTTGIAEWLTSGIRSGHGKIKARAGCSLSVRAY